MPLGRLGWLLVLAPGSAYLVWLSGPPRVFHCLPRIRSQAQGPVSSPPSWALVAQTCPLPGGPPPGSCSGTRDCKKEEKNKTEKTCYYFPHAAPPSLSLVLRIVRIWIFIWILHSNCKTFVVRTNGDTFHINQHLQVGRKRDKKTSEHFLILSISLICKVRAQDEKLRTSWAKEDSQKFIFKNKNCPVLCDYYLIIFALI